MNDKHFKNSLITESLTIKEAMQRLNDMGGKDSQTLFVVNQNNQLVGTLTDGDIRRGLLSGRTISDNVQSVMFKNFRFLQQNKFNLQEIDNFRKQEIQLIPFLNTNKEIVRIIAISEKRSILPVDAFLMAGGEGKRLRPLTNDLPKPLLKVGSKPIILHNIERIRSYGIDNIYISVNYLGEKIEEFFSSYETGDVSLSFVWENKPLGTIGSVALAENLKHDTVLVMNSDLLTNIDFEDFYRTFVRSGASMAVAGVPYKVDVPYAVMEVDEDKIISFKEKPTYTYYSNGGIYLIKRELLDYIPRDVFYNATDFMEKLISDNYKVIYYPILGYWLDIGQHEDYLKAQEDINHIKL
jgi:dTDP-glucose pyrophosphorylase